MSRSRPKIIASSIRQRLLNRAKEMGRPFSEVLQYYAMERFLYRLSRSPFASSFVLKGALAFRVWQVNSLRPTLDIDLLGKSSNRLDSVITTVRKICFQEVEPDGLTFDLKGLTAERITEDADYHGVRVRFSAELARARIPIQLDVGFGDVLVTEPGMAEYPTILDLPAPRLSIYRRESTIAEKFEAMVKLGSLNSRMKDYFDIWSLSRQFDFKGETLSAAIQATFHHRGTAVQIQPSGLTEDFAVNASKSAQWKGFLRKSRIEGVSENLVEVIQAIRAFLLPVAEALAQGRVFHAHWKAPGPWQIRGKK